MIYGTDKLGVDRHIHTDTHRQTDAGNDNTWRPKLASGNEVNFDFEVKFDLSGQDQSLPKTIGILTNAFYTYGPNLVILVWTGEELSRWQASAYRTHRRMDGWTDTQTDRCRQRQYPKAKNWPRVKIKNDLSKLGKLLR